MTTYQVIFQSQNGKPNRNDGWLDYCREQAPVTSEADAKAWGDRECVSLARRIGCAVQCRVEVWN